MKAVGLYRYLPIEDEESLIDVEVEIPVPTGRDILVEVKAISVNPVDTKVRSPKDKVEPELKILGWDVAGVVASVGPDCTLFQPGDSVFYAGSITRQGGNSSFHLVDERIVGRMPSRLSFAEAAALPLTSITAWEGLYDRLGVSDDPAVNRDKRILIVGAAGGVGSIATQLAKLTGLTVIGTASRSASEQWVKDHGADFVINHYEPFVPQLKALNLDHVDYIFCLNATDDHWRKMADALAPQGVICSIVETKAPLDLNLLKSKSGTYAWEYMFTRAMYETDDMIEQHHLLNQLADLVDAGRVKTTLTEVLSPIHAANLRKAHAMIESGSTIGKIVLENFS
ncbi:zinc-binding alcohol dehydrogenase family protein [Alicyclobacillus fastidiosus]|uniref:Zinc-type alcohol dehydrogenase-like protein n=1 Tax=Alicyclobacillus fastidiosus TaxID=392011 RepID=A0ABY6ZNV1_9BACL|nr:zinc-binding alcohol dehydrogenase family protein [Alicyclobacillus fastidiosus]WAH44522.1 zinc-binding alcohol dehydrogenase family protein [Alicyclobacillus fastidiosus]